MRKLFVCVLPASIPVLAGAQGKGKRNFPTESISTQETIISRKAAGGLVASCAGKGTADGLGSFQNVALITWSEAYKHVRFVRMGSMGEIDDHKCGWKDEMTLVCDRLAHPRRAAARRLHVVERIAELRRPANVEIPAWPRHDHGLEAS